MGKVIFVGAGPGDCDLITVKGVKALKTAQVVLYDALLSTELFDYCKSDCKFIYVGKRKGKKEFSQDEINKLRHDAANAVQQLNAVRGIVRRTLTALELGDEPQAKRMLRGLLSALKEPDS